MPEPSLLDWLNSRLSNPHVQRLTRLGAAGAAGLVGLAKLLNAGGQDFLGFVLLVVAAGLLLWGLRARAPVEPAGGAAGMEMPGLSLGPRLGPAAREVPDAEARHRLRLWLATLRLPVAILLALLGQAALHSGEKSLPMGLALYALGLLLFVTTLFYDRLLGVPPAATDTVDTSRLTFRWVLLVTALLAGLVAFLAAGGNRFQPEGVLAWVIAVGAWLAAVWEVDRTPAESWARLRSRLAELFNEAGLAVRLSRWTVIVLLVLAVGAYFRFYRLDTIPPEMTSDHVEKIFDVQDVLNGQRPIYFERNTGREPLQFYFAALVATVLKTGSSFFTLKITGAVAGFLLLPYVYLLGREVQDKRLGLLAMLLAAISFWATAISRVGLRFPLTPLFVAPALYHLLRGFRTGRRNEFLISGLFLGIGLYGYSTIRVLPLLLGVALLWLALPLRRAAQNGFQSRAGLRRLMTNTVLLFATTATVFLPLYRYAIEPDSYFWYRTLSRLGETEAQVNGPLWRIFLENNWNALRMFNWKGDLVWVNTIRGLPVLDQVTGALFILGAVFLLLRLLLRRDQVAGLLLLAVPVLMLPSTLSFAFPDENPSVVRAAGAIPVVMLIAAYPLWLLLNRLPAVWTGPQGRRNGVLGVGALLSLSLLINHANYFQRYPREYLGPAQNASEIGAVARNFADSVGSLDRVYMCLHPHWADTRAVGIYAGQVGWEQVLPAADFGQLAGDPRPLLVIVNPRSAECVGSLRQIFPNGTFTVYSSARGTEKDFLLFSVPGSQVVDDASLLREQ